MVKEAYCSFEVSKLLKEKGFDEPCWIKYDNEGYLTFNHVGYINSEKPCDDFCALAPTHQMAMGWLREVYSIHIEIYVIKNYDKKVCEYTYTIMDLNFPGSDDGIDCCNKYKTYEEACEAAIKYCLEKLI